MKRWLLFDALFYVEMRHNGCQPFLSILDYTTVFVKGPFQYFFPPKSVVHGTLIDSLPHFSRQNQWYMILLWTAYCQVIIFSVMKGYHLLHFYPYLGYIRVPPPAPPRGA